MITTYHATITPLWYMLSFFFPCIHFFMFHNCMSSLFSLRLTWLADPALVTSVYPNRMQYMPHVLQEASLLDGVDAGVRGNGRRFSKTSSYPPCRRYAFIFFYPIFSRRHRPLCSRWFTPFPWPTFTPLPLQIIPTLLIAFVSCILSKMGMISL